MNTVYTSSHSRESRGTLSTFGMGLLRLTWHVIRLPILTLLVILEPVIRWSLSITALVGVLTAFFWEFFSPRPYHHFWIVLTISVGIGMLQIPYYLLIRLFSNVTTKITSDFN